MQGERLGPYLIDRELGAGGMGTVYAAQVAEKTPGLETGATVALKVVHPHLLEQPGFFRRFMREAQIGASIRHENVVGTLMADALGQDHFLVMEYVEGQNLRDLLQELETVPEELCRHIGREVAKGLAAVHAAGVVHRDLKPENVLITPDHVVKVMDLGVAQLTQECIRLSHSGAFVGSVEYAAPEQFGGDVDHRCDLHALGLLLYELACGQHPYRADSFPEVMKKVREDAPRRLGEINPQLSAFYEELVHALLAKSRDERFADAGALLAVLEDGEESSWWKERAKALRVSTNRPIRRIRIPRETAVYGRELELDRLRALYGLAKSGDGQVVLIEGEAGIGKSRLVDELITRLQTSGEDLDFLFGSYPPGGAATGGGAFSVAYREHLGEAGSAGVLTRTPLLVPAFDAVLRGEPAPSGVVELTKDSLATCFIHATRQLASERPTVVLIDDLHFAPEEARDLFTAVALAAPGHRVLLIGTMRPGVPEDWIANVARLEHATHVVLPRLGPKDLAALLKDSFRSEELARALGVQVGEKSDGNPFFAFEIIRGLREGQFITQKDDGTWASTRVIDEIQIPSSVLDLVNARVADLTEEERDLLDVACCWGFEFDPGLVGDVLGIGRIPLLKRFGQIERKHRLVRSSGRNYVFDHHQVQEALYGSLHEQMREEYHAALAEALEARSGAAETDPDELDGSLCVDLCDHFLKGARGESALRYLEAAETHLRKGYLNAEVIALTERALAVPDLLTGVTRAKALNRLSGVLSLVGRPARQEECAREAERLAGEAGDDALISAAAMRLGQCLTATSRVDEAEAAHHRALQFARSANDQTLVVDAMRGLEGVAFSLGDYRRLEELALERLALAREAGYEHGLGSINLGIAYDLQGRAADAEREFSAALALFRRLGDRTNEANAAGNLGNVFRSQGRLAEAQEHYERSLAMSRKIGYRQGEARATGNLGLVLQSQGRLPEAREYHERALSLCREIGNRQAEASATGQLGFVFYSQGHLAEAREHIGRYLSLCHEIGDRAGEASATGNLGNVFYSLGRLGEAQEHVERHLALCREIGFREGEAIAQHNLGGLAREEGESARSEERLLACLAVSAQIGHRHLEGATHLALGSLRAATSGGEGGREALVAARDAAAANGFPGIEVLARCELALPPGGDAEDAVAAVMEHGQRLEAEERREARLLLWQATGDRAHLVEAKRLLDEALAKVSAEYHEAMCTNLRVNREILAAWREEFGDGADDDSPGTESVTKAGL